MDPSSKQLFADASVPCMFEHCFVCTVDPGGKDLVPKIIYRYPPSTEVDLLAKTVPLFCYPDPSAMQASEKGSSETFPFVLTDEKGTKRFGYCRRYADPAKDETILSEACCIISAYSSFPLFSTVLGIVEQKRRVSAIEVFTFLKSVQSQPPISPGESVAIKSFGKQFGRDQTVLSRPAGGDLWNDQVTYQPLIQALGKRNVIQLMNALLFEQKIIITSSSLSKLASCAMASMALIQPFVWELVFIPILPASLVDYTSAPMPFVMGVLSHLLPRIPDQVLQDLFVVDLDNRKIVSQCTFPSIPPSDKELLYKSFRVLTNSMKVTGALEDRAFEATCNSFFIRLFGNYRKFMQRDASGCIFDRTAFLESKSPTTHNFYSELFETQIFTRFYQVREEWLKQGTEFESFPGPFERELTRRGFQNDPDPEVTNNHFSLLRVIKDIFQPSETLLTAQEIAEASANQPPRPATNSRRTFFSKKRDQPVPKEARMTQVQQQAQALSRTMDLSKGSHRSRLDTKTTHTLTGPLTGLTTSTQSGQSPSSASNPISVQLSGSGDQKFAYLPLGSPPKTPFYGTIQEENTESLPLRPTTTAAANITSSDLASPRKRGIATSPPISPRGNLQARPENGKSE